MSKRMQSKRPAAFGTYLLSDILLIALVLLTLVPFMRNTIHTLNGRTRETMTSTIENATSNLENMLSNLESMLLSSRNESFAKLAAVFAQPSGSDYYAMRQASAHLAALVLANPSLQDILVAYADKGVIVNATGGFDTQTIFEAYYESATLYDELFEGKGKAFFIPDRLFVYGSPKRTERLFGYGLSLSQFGHGQACILIRTASYLTPSVLQVLGSDGYLLLTDYAGNPILSIGDEAAAQSGGDRLTAHYNSPGGKLTVFASTPRLLPGALSGVLLLLGLCVLAAITVGISLAVWNAYRHSKPIKRLLDELTQYSRRIQGNQTEIETLRNALMKRDMENDDFQTQLAAYRKAQYDSTVTRLFTTSRFSREELSRIRDAVGEIPDRYMVAYATLEKLPLQDTRRDEMGLLALHFIRESLPAECICHPVNPQAIAVLINDDTDVDRLQAIGGAVNLQWSYSQVYEGVENVSLALEEARLVREWDGMPKSSVTLSDLQGLYHNMIAGNCDKAVEQVAELFAGATMDNTEYLYDSVRFVIYLSAQASQLPAVAPRYDAAQDSCALCDKLCDVITGFCQAVHSEKRSHNETLKQQILSHIHAHFGDSALYAGAIAERVGVSEKYLYNFVKEQTGLSVGEYVQSLRMEKATEILCEGRVPVKEVYAAVGFNSENSFYKAFKRTFGVSPSQYRGANGK